MLSAEGYDAVVRHGPLADSRLVAWRLAPSRRVLVASPDYLARHGTPGAAGDLEGHRGIFYTNRGVDDWRFPGSDGATIVRGRAALRVNNGDMMRDAALAGIGIALLPTFIVGADIASGRLRVDRCRRPVRAGIHLCRPSGGTAAFGQVAGFRRVLA